ncbi:phage portal protein [Enterococcus wangshanyuanii]|uniref:Portal protein n=1 Tax=Enterococcus wangshanyuanii TaxID=2005703 RepID=A0ABQ1PW80_9ENTE|nr:phage portal protein [Enterococcus wangshanyuanii]GGD05225.1 portal protein [Enterococcus wangshanyuanii]
MLYNKLSLKNYKRIRTKYATQLAEGLFDPNGFMEDMQPFFNDRERKYLAYTSEKNEIDDRQKPKTNIIKVNNKLHAGMYNIVVDQAVNHFTGIPIKWDYDVSEQRRTIIQRAKDFFLGNDLNHSKTPEEFDILAEMVDNLRFSMLDSESATYQGATGVAFRLLEPVKVGESWELWASNIEPWFAERYQNGAVFIREKYDTMQRKFYQEMKVVTENEIETYDRYIDSSLIGITNKFKLTDKVKNPLENIYLSEFKNNTNRYCDFEVAEEISDAIDRSVSDQQNEVEQFKLAYMMVTGTKLDEESAKRMMDQLGIINMKDPNSKVEYVTKDINKDFNEYHLDLLKRQFYTITKAIDFNDEVFKSNSSGEARKWQIIALEAKTNTKEQFFREGLKETAETLAAFIQVKDKKEIDPKKIIFTFSRSLPTDIGYLAEALPKLAPYVSKRTIMTQIPFVDDVDYELQMMDIEQGQTYPDGEYSNLGGESNGKDTQTE